MRLGDIERLVDGNAVLGAKPTASQPLPVEARIAWPTEMLITQPVGKRIEFVAEAGAGGVLADQFAQLVAGDVAGEFLGCAGGAAAGQHVERLADHPRGARRRQRRGVSARLEPM